MNRGKILKMRPGRDANCSSYAYIAEVMVSFVGYGVFLLVLVVAQVGLQARRLAAKPWIGRLRIVSWVIPHLVAMPVLWIWASGTGATNYGSVVCIGALELALLIGLGVGFFKIRSSQAARAAAELCPECDRPTTASEAECPWCGADLTGYRSSLAS